MRTQAVNQYESNKSQQDNNPQIRKLDQRVDELSQKIQREKSRWCGRNQDLINTLEKKLIVVTTERDELYGMVTNLTRVGREADTLINDLNEAFKSSKESRANAEYGIGAGFGAGAVAAVALGLNAAWTSVCVITSACIGGFIGESLTKKSK